MGIPTDEIAAFLKRWPHSSAREIARMLGVTRADVNRVLYRNLALFERMGDSPPRWSNAPQDREPIQRPKAPGNGRLSDQERRTLEARVRALLDSVDGGSSSHMAAARPSRIETVNPLYPWQRDAIGAWHAAGRVGVIEAVTGAGKTRVALEAIAEELEVCGKALVLVPTVLLLKQWEKAIRARLPDASIGWHGAGRKDELCDVDVLLSTVQSACRVSDRYLYGSGLLVADECHRYGAERFALALDEGFPRRLGLSATYMRNDDGNDEFLTPYFGGVCFSLKYRRAIREGAVSRFKVLLVGTELTPGEQAQYEEHTQAASEARGKLLAAGVRGEPFGEFMKEVAILSNGGSSVTWAARKYLDAFSKRRQLLAETRAKFEVLPHLAEVCKVAGRTLVFTERVDGAHRAAQVLGQCGVPALAMDGGFPVDFRRAMIERFEAGRFSALVAPRILDEGIDLPETDLGIIVAASKTKRQMIQRMGRIIRNKPDGRVSLFVVLYVKRTSDDIEEGAHEDFLQDMIDVSMATAKIDASLLTPEAIVDFWRRAGRSSAP